MLAVPGCKGRFSAPDCLSLHIQAEGTAWFCTLARSAESPTVATKVLSLVSVTHTFHLSLLSDAAYLLHGLPDMASLLTKKRIMA